MMKFLAKLLEVKVNKAAYIAKSLHAKFVACAKSLLKRYA